MASSAASYSVQIRCKGVLFDMDDILISSLGSVERGLTRWANLHGVQELLAALRRDCWTVVTSAIVPLARVRLAAGDIPVPERLITSECVAEAKPHPAPCRDVPIRCGRHGCIGR